MDALELGFEVWVAGEEGLELGMLLEGFVWAGLGLWYWGCALCVLYYCLFLRRRVWGIGGFRCGLVWFGGFGIVFVLEDVGFEALD